MNDTSQKVSTKFMNLHEQLVKICEPFMNIVTSSFMSNDEPHSNYNTTHKRVHELMNKTCLHNKSSCN